MRELWFTLLMLALTISFWTAVIWVAIHFIVKFW